MVIRRPPREVFEAFVDPAITTNFWFTKSSGRLESGATVEWAFEMYNISFPVQVKAVEPERRIEIEWPSANGPATVEWRFTPVGSAATFVEITNSGFSGTGDQMVNEAMDSSQGFAFVLAALKAYLEHGVRLNVVLDKVPQPELAAT